MNTALFGRGHCQACGVVLLRLAATRARYTDYCSRECFARMAAFDEDATWEFLVLNSRWAGGHGFCTLEERMAAAVRDLSQDDTLLGDLLIEIVADWVPASR